MITLDIQQQTPEWIAAKCGIPSASDFDKIVTSTGEPSKQRTKYLYQLAGERITGFKEESYQNGAMLRGAEMESEARYLYEMIMEETIDQIGICYPDEQKLISCSPDGLIGQDGGLEIKCPSLAIHVGYVIDGRLPSDYFQQVQGSMYVTGRAWWAFMSYYPGVKPLIIKIKRDEKFISILDSEITKFCKELNEVVEKLK